MMIHALFVGFCFLCDEILMVLFPSDFLMQGLLFVSNMGFCAIMLTVRKFDWINTCLFAFGFGMIYDFLFAKDFLVYAIVFLIVAALLRIWTKHLTDTLLECLVLCIVTIFVKDYLVYLYQIVQRATTLTFFEWAASYELLTLLANAILAMSVIFLIRIKDDYLEVKALRVRKGERVEWFRLKSKQ